MSRLLSILTILTFLLNISWGGQAAYNWGMHDDGRVVNTIPSTDDTYKWTAYGAGLTFQTWDELSLAVASIDHELPTVRFIKTEGAASESQTFIWFAFSPATDPLPPACTDGNSATNCFLAETICLNQFRSGAYNLCKEYKVNVYWNRIGWDAINDQMDPYQKLYKVLRHEVTHAMGFKHGTGGPMANGSDPLSNCQKATVEYYQSLAAGTEWVYAVPESCSP